MNFKEMVQQDRDNVIFNLGELGQQINLNGRHITAIKEQIGLAEWGNLRGYHNQNAPGMMDADLILYLRQKDVEHPLSPEATIVVDGVKYVIRQVGGEDTLEVVLKRAVSRNAGNGRYTRP